MVVSWPPCWLAVLAKTLPTLPIRPPLAQILPVRSRKLRIWAAMLPNRVGVPKMIASASRSLVGLDHRHVGEGRLRPLRPALLQRLVGHQLRDLEERDLRPVDRPCPLGNGLGHLVDVPVHAVEDDLDFHARRFLGLTRRGG